METKILIVEDEPKLGLAMLQLLTENSYLASLASDGLQATALFESSDFNLILLDINLPHKSGFSLCEEFRKKKNNVPIIMITALSDIDDKMTAFSFGADDYLVKPFHFDELLAKIKVFIKRANSDKTTANVISIANLSINFDTKVVYRDKQAIDLTQREFALLELLARNQNRVVAKSEIAEKVWGIDFETGTNTIEVYINFLRKKIDKDFEPKLVHTRPGFGYSLFVGNEH